MILKRLSLIGCAVMLFAGGRLCADEVLFANYFDIKTSSAAGTEVTGKVNLMRNKDCPAVPVPLDYAFVITSDPSGIFEIAAQRDAENRLFGALKVKAGQSISATPVDYPIQIELRQGTTVQATVPLTVRALPQTLHEQLLAYATTHCRTFDRLFARVRPNDAQVLDWITQVETNNGRFVSADVNEPLDFYTRPLSDYENTVNNPNNLSVQWQRVGANLGGMGFAYTNTNAQWSTTYGPNGTPANRARLKNALFLAFTAFIDRIPLDPAQSVFNGQPLGDEFGDGVFRLNEKGVATHTDITHQWIWVDPVTGPAVWLMPDVIAGIKTGDAASIAMHEKLMRFFQLSFGAVKVSYRNLRGSPHVWSGMAPEQVGYTDGAFSDGNLGHRFRNWLTLPAIWVDYNRPATYMPYFYDGYTWPGITPTLVTGPNSYRFKPGWSPHGVLEDFAFWARKSYPDTHLYLSEGANPDGSFSHHLRGNLNDITMIAYGHESVIAPTPGLRMLRDTHIDTGSESFNRIADHWLHSYDKMIYKGDFDYVATGFVFLSDHTGFVNGIPNAVDQLVAARQPGTQINQLTALQNWASALRNDTQQATGDFPFWVNNYHIHRKGGANASNDSYYFAVKMGSDRTGTSDDPAGKPFHMGSGTMQTRVTNTEYDSQVRARLDWHALSGVTEEWRSDAMPVGELTDQVAGSSFAGTASDGVAGVSAMRYRPAATSTYATANADKAWFFPGDLGIALGSGVARRAGMPGQSQPIITTIDQCRWQGALTYAVNGNAPLTVANTTNLSQDITLTAPSWLHQGSVGYLIFPQGNQPLYLRGGTAVVDSHSDDTSAATLLHLALGHGVNPGTDGPTQYYYIVVPNKTAAEMPALLSTLQSQVEIISNGSNIQGIRHTGLEVIELVFHAAGTATLSDASTVTVDRPAIVQLRKSGSTWNVAASDPIHDFNATSINLSVKQPLKSGSYNHTLPGVVPRAGEPVIVTQSPGGIAKVRVALPDLTDAPNLDYQEQLYANVPIRVAVPLNNPPSVANDAANTNEDTPVTINVLSNDGASLTIGELAQPGHGTTAIVNGQVQYTPELNWNGVDSFTYAAFDGSGNAAAATVTVTVQPVDDAPLFAANPFTKAAAAVAVAYQGESLASSAIDPDAGDTVTFSKISGPSWLNVASNGALSGTPDVSPGVYSWTVRATDNDNMTTDATLQITVVDADSDNDGLVNSREITAGTGVLNPDSDNDGFSDGYEVDRNTNPLDANSKPTSVAAALWDFNDATTAPNSYDRIGGVPGVLTDGASISADALGRTGLPGDRALFCSSALDRMVVSNVAFLNAAAANNDLTISFWQKFNASRLYNFWAVSPTDQRGLSAQIPWSDNKAYHNNNGNSGSASRMVSGVISDVTWTQWNHIAIVRRTPTAGEIWINGVMRVSNASMSALLTNFTSLIVGSDSTGGENLRGLMDDFAVFDTALTSGDIQLLATGGMPDQFPSPYTAWQQQKFGSDAGNPLIAGDDADPDKDGRINLLEYALGSNPNQPNALGWTHDLTRVGNADFLRLNVQRNPAATDLYYNVETTSDVSLPATWNRANITLESSTPGALIARDSVGGPTRFIRLKVSKTQPSTP